MTVSVVGAGTARSSEVGASFRRQRPGPELNLIDWFLQAKPFTVPQGCRATMFLEPLLESGYPDLVLVIWRESRARKWAAARAGLRELDIRVMHYVTRAGPQTSVELEQAFARPLGTSLKRLYDARMVRWVRERWIARPLSKTFAATRIIAIEAKVNHWRAALNQAHLNTWFATESYILIPQIPRRTLLVQQANALGVGVLQTGMKLARKVPCRDREHPRSYASWLFNEWAWRSASFTV